MREDHFYSKEKRNVQKDACLKFNWILNFSKEGTSLFPNSKADITASTELTSTLLLSLMGSTSNSRLERLLRFTTYVLFVAQAMSMTNLKRFLTDLEARTQILNHVKEEIHQSVFPLIGSLKDVEKIMQNDSFYSCVHDRIIKNKTDFMYIFFQTLKS